MAVPIAPPPPPPAGPADELAGLARPLDAPAGETTALGEAAPAADETPTAAEMPSAEPPAAEPTAGDPAEGG
ncbi:MAG TPA: hypothetical protein VEG29_07310 [Candidatus Binatia bacterium]|nr:hypothetical protein [Candidatus Binatia bacterium]